MASAHLHVIVRMDLLETIVARVSFVISKDFSFIALQLLFLRLIMWRFSDNNDCRGDPCNNGGNCTDGIATYTCTCPDGFKGSDCETSIPNDLFHLSL